MKIAFIHYHLKTGGVTTVLKHQVGALQESCLVLTGDRAGAEWPCPIMEIPGLGYDQADRPCESSDAVAEAVEKAINRVWPGGCDILHIHNPLLAKNARFLEIINRLQRMGIPLFLQIHDFAEDGRADCRFEAPYPADCHYGVINSRDKEFLLRAGLKEEGLHLLPNAVSPLTATGGGATVGNRVLYPVRAIRRKNIGEAILLSLFFKDGQRLAITQPPNSPADYKPYRQWVDWTRMHQLPVDFEAGRQTAFDRLLAEAPFVITTSVAEGFGYAFLEPWTAGLPVLGRRIDGVCRDIEFQGVELEGFYPRIDIPLAWFDTDQLAVRWQNAVLVAARAFNHPMEAETVAAAFEQLTIGESIDFGILDERFQCQVLGTLLENPSRRQTLIELNPWLDALETKLAPPAVIARNRQAVAGRYSINGYGERLRRIHDRVVQRPVRQRIDKAALFSAFFKTDRFSLLRWNHG